MEEKKVLRIVSIVARIPDSNIKRGSFTFEIGDEVVSTKAMRSRAGELVFIEAQQINVSDSDREAKVKVFSVNPNE